jgi:hypothetical protein
MDRINKWLTFVSNIGVVVGLAFLAIEISQTNTLMEASAYQQRSSDLLSMSNLVIESDVLSGALSKIEYRKNICTPKEMNLSVLTAQEKTVVHEYQLSQIFRLQNVARQHTYGLIDDEYHATATIGTIGLLLPIWEHFEIPQAGLARAILESHPEQVKNVCIDGQALYGADRQ